MNLPDTIAEYLEFVAANNEVGTHEAYTQRLQRFQDWVKGRRVTAPLMRKYHIDLLNTGLSRRTVVLYRRAVRTFYTWAVENDYTKVNPVGRVRQIAPAKVERPTFTEDEYQRILEQAAKQEDEFWPYAVRCAWETGLRLGDVAELERSNVDYQEHAIHAEPRKTKRFGKTVSIPISADLVTEVQKQCLISGNSQFVASKMAFLYSIDRHKTLSMQFIRLAEKSRVFGKSFHCFRHSFVTRLLARGVSAEIISTMTGQTLAQVMGYAHLSLADKRKALGINAPHGHHATTDQAQSLHLLPETREGMA
jgi:integrase